MQDNTVLWIGWYILVALYLRLIWPWKIWFWITAAHVLWILFNWNTKQRGGRPISAVKNAQRWKNLAQKFPITLEKTADLDPKQRYLLGYHPHGVCGIGCIFNFATNATGFSRIFPGITPHMLSHTAMHYFPPLRELMSMFGIGDVSPESIEYVLKDKGHMAVIVIGGAREGLMTDAQKNYLVLKQRKGFVRMAIKTGAFLVPSYTFGENQAWEMRWPVRPGDRLKWWQKVYAWSYGFSPILHKGRGFWNWPYFVPIHTIVGKPIPVVQCDDPTQETIDKLHAQYVSDLVQLYENNKARFGMKDKPLIFAG